MITDNDNYPPVVQLPTELSDEAAAHLIEFLYDVARELESLYAAQLYHYYHPRDHRQLDIFDQSDPPF